MSRLALSDTDKQARDWFVETTKGLGCKVIVDEMGNTFAVRPGRRNDVAPIYAGSHLDTQPAAGRYDGILGILAGVEMLSLLRDHDVETEYPIGVVNWTKCVRSSQFSSARASANPESWGRLVKRVRDSHFPWSLPVFGRKTYP